MKSLREDVTRDDAKIKEATKHSSQSDAAKGFGGKYGVQKGSQDKVGAVGGDSTYPISPFTLHLLSVEIFAILSQTIVDFFGFLYMLTSNRQSFQEMI